MVTGLVTEQTVLPEPCREPGIENRKCPPVAEAKMCISNVEQVQEFFPMVSAPQVSSYCVVLTRGRNVSAVVIRFHYNRPSVLEVRVMVCNIEANEVRFLGSWCFGAVEPIESTERSGCS